MNCDDHESLNHHPEASPWLMNQLSCDRFQNTAIIRLGIYGSYTVGNWGCSILWQLYLLIGFAWLCERWYRILLIGCLRLSLGCDTWFTISYANT